MTNAARAHDHLKVLVSTNLHHDWALRFAKFSDQLPLNNHPGSHPMASIRASKTLTSQKNSSGSTNVPRAVIAAPMPAHVGETVQRVNLDVVVLITVPGVFQHVNAKELAALIVFVIITVEIVVRHVAVRLAEISLPLISLQNFVCSLQQYKVLVKASMQQNSSKLVHF